MNAGKMPMKDNKSIQINGLGVELLFKDEKLLFYLSGRFR